MIRLRWIAALLTGLVVFAGLSAVMLPWQRFYENETSPWLSPTHTLSEWKLQAALKTPLAMAESAVGDGPDPSRQKLIALTFDDGPYPLYTPYLLDVLDRLKVKATFFLEGCHVDEYPELTREIGLAGHELANHTYSHRREKEMGGPQALREELLKTEEAIFRATGLRPHCFRPAGGNMTPEGLATVQSLGYAMVNATVNAGDWWVQDQERLLRGSYRGRSREGIVLMHSGRLASIRTLPGYVNALRAKGFRFVTVSELALACGDPIPPCPRLAGTSSALSAR